RTATQEPVRRQPWDSEQGRSPPPVSKEHGQARQTADHLDQSPGNETHGNRKRRPRHSQVEVARDSEISGQLRILEMTHARRANTRLGEPVIKPRGGTVAKVGADRVMD